MSASRARSLAAVAVLVAAGLTASVGTAPPVAATVRTNAAGFPPLSDMNHSSDIGFAGTNVITDVSVTIHNVSSLTPDNMDIMLISPWGAGVVLLSDACADEPISGAELTFDSSAASTAPASGDCDGGTFLPTNLEAGDGSEEYPQPVAATSLEVYDGELVGGSWTLYVSDDSGAGGDTLISGGWSLDITTRPVNMKIPATGSSGNAAPYPRSVTVSGQLGTITDLDVTIPGLYHTYASDIDLLMVGPGGQAVELMSDACAEEFATFDVTLTFSDEAGQDLDEFNACRNGTFRPTDYTDGDGPDTYPSPAPPVVPGNTLSLFDGLSPNGTWRFYLVDDATDNIGILIDPPALDFDLRIPPKCQGLYATVELGEGDTPTARSDVIVGTPGNDTINGLGGNDTVCALGGDDVIQGGTGADSIDGGTGVDTASYVSSGQPVTVSLATTAAQNTGTTTGTDTLRLLENIWGGSGADTLTGNTAANNLQGRNGGDTLNGSSGDDTLAGGSGTDTCNGSTGTDTGSSCETATSIP